MHCGGGVAVRGTNGETPLPDTCGWLHFGCWSQHLGCTKHLLRVEVRARCGRAVNRGARRRHALETLLCPHSGPVNVSGLGPKTLPVRVGLGGGAAARSLVTDHQAGERERRSNQTVRLGAFRPDAPSQSVLYIRKGYQAGSARCWPVRRQAPPLPSGVTRSRNAVDQTLVSATACSTRPAPAYGRAR